MDDACRERLAGCFERVFPNLSRSEILECSPGTVAAWDSVAHITLLSLIGDEFAIEIDFEAFDNAMSFAGVLDIVRAKLTDGKA